MARLLSALVLWGAALSSGAPFSHKLHLKLKPDCTSCHAGAVASKTLADNNLPTEKACKSCHASSSIKAPRATNLSRFNHELHLKFGNVAPVIARAIDNKTYLSDPGDMRRYLNGKNPCVACHRGLEESESVTRAAHPQMADCLVCHSKADPPFSCVKCHVESPALKPVSHSNDWLERHSRRGTIAERTSCAVCHGRQFTCLGCH